ncbi:MAG TPA: hypothetical protein VNZ86_17430 [Bacteroidia bacterium]|jgi:hypothetical protein|nr:hypothetical protein [Bacteroidia bacterium]
MAHRISTIILAVTFCFLGVYITVDAQENKDYASYPYWIRMMDDSTTNYFQARNAFDAWWKNKPKPPGENEQLSKGGKENSSKTKQIPYSFEYKKFLNWEMHVKPYVQDDGHILFPSQRLQLSRDARKANSK